MTIVEIRNILEAPYDRKVWKTFIQTAFSSNEILANEVNLNFGNSNFYENYFSLEKYKKIGSTDRESNTK